MVLKITNEKVTGDKPKLFIHSAMHAREYTTVALTLAFAESLLNNYQGNLITAGLLIITRFISYFI